MRRVIRAHDIEIAPNVRTFICSECELEFESDEYRTEYEGNVPTYIDYCPVCGVGTWVKEKTVYARQDTT